MNDKEHWKNITKLFSQEELLSQKQFQKIVDIDELKDATNIIKDTKIGHGMNFLLTNLKDNLEILLKEGL